MFSCHLVIEHHTSIPQYTIGNCALGISDGNLHIKSLDNQDAGGDNCILIVDEMVVCGIKCENYTNEIKLEKLNLELTKYIN